MAVIAQTIKSEYAIYNGDSCEVLPTLPDESVGFSVYSPPFAELYNYSSSERDLSNCKSYGEFLEHYGFIVEQMGRVTKPGRVNAIHCMDLIGPNQTLRDFPGDIIRLHERFGFRYFGRVCIWKEPLMIAIRTRQLSLMHKQIVKDSTMCRPALPDHILLFRKGGQNAEPVAHPMGLTRYAGETDPEKRRRNGQQPIPDHLAMYRAGWDDPKTNKWAHWIWQQYASPVWMDIRPGRLLPYRQAKGVETEKHICPLQLDPIERTLALYSNPGDVVLTPFMGIGSEVYVAAQMGRKPIGVELKPSYYAQAERNIGFGFDHPVAEDNDADMFDGLSFGDVEAGEEELIDQEASE